MSACLTHHLCLVTVLALTMPARAQAPKPIDFAHDIAPILKARCSECHTNGKYKGSVSFDTREALLKSKVVTIGKSKDSEVYQRITNPDKDKRMPPKGEPLSAKEIALFTRWIDEGLAWDAGFTFKVTAYVAPLKPRRPELPPPRPGLEHPIDRILDAYFQKHKVATPAPLDDTAFVRRVYLDVVGLLPAPTETEAYLNDRTPDKRARLIRKLLDERRAFTDHWLSFWNDLLRNDYAGTGYIDGGRKQITPWLYRSIHDNKPYDQFVRELISPSAESEGFIKGIQWRGNVNASQVTELQFSQNVSQVFFGINLKCASCHDSFIDYWKLDDAYALAAIIADRPLEIHRCDKAMGKTATARFLWPELGSIDAQQPKAKRLEQFARLVSQADNGRFTRTIANRLWQRFFGRGIVHPVDMMANKPWSEDLIDYLGVYLADQKYDLAKLMEHMLTSRAYQSKPALLEKETPAEDFVFCGPELRRLSAEQFIDALWMIGHSGPNKAAAPVKLPEFEGSVPPERRFLRSSLVNADALMRSLGRPNREQVVTTRPDQLTTLQALDLSNGQILDDTLARGAAYLLKTHDRTSDQQLIEEVYLSALCRRPSAEELATAQALLGSPRTASGMADLLWAVFMLPEFQLLR
ncbi:MAG: PSD1 and planctomycete cytochrome C domain-containing protein [Gemmataceae bacterium]|nr:PSD1 and planctomycete cytochrome C domain-containing protein [Gemmataceae bacterium]MCI0739107.1 PSD1 and planctomycete cytochrome C domain-containing protein [Gemmataceae bacterium]